MVSKGYKRFYLNDDLDAIEECVEILYSVLGDAKASSSYKLHIGYGDDLPNTIDIHEDHLHMKVLMALEDCEN